MEAGRPETKEVTWSDIDDGKCRAKCRVGQRPISEIGDWVSDIGGRNDMVMTGPLSGGTRLGVQMVWQGQAIVVMPCC
jgi:hypothetical protein